MVATSSSDASTLMKRRFWSRVRSALHYRSRDAIGWVAFQTLGRVLNGRRFPLMLTHRPDSHYDLLQIPEYRALYNAWISGNRTNNAGDLPRLYLLIQNCQQIMRDQVPGDFVELGVYKGNSATTLAHFARKNGRQLYLFDTFSGFDRRDLKGVDSTAHMEFSDTSIRSVQSLVGIDSVTFVQGFFPRSCDGIDMPRQVALAHIDCDLYEPMKAALEKFYPVMASGGLMIMHDYSSGHWVGATKAVNEFFADKPERPVLMPDKSGTAIVRISSNRA